jgi:glutamyl/glutaminyl-tRNA synthetase
METKTLQQENEELRALLSEALEHIGVEPYPIYEATEPVRKLKKRIKKLLENGKA